MNLTQQTYRRLRDELISGRWQAGKRLSINDLAKQLGVSRTPVRDAINQLALEGMLEPVAKSGVVVTTPSYADLLEIVELRCALEPFAVELAVQHITYVQIAQLRQLCREMKRIARWVLDNAFRDVEANLQLQHLDHQFHQVILEAAGNRRLKKIVEDYQLLTHKVRYPSEPSPRHLAITLFEHWRIYRAFAQGNVREAKRWMTRHTHHGGEVTLAAAREKEQLPA